ncbi:hypothetical protein BY458DRAFT_497043 [Sporodiniella umbellata]|nr:hypothetical protein BY458DRAFT_497043 [Sporodiniella umbellata]
MAVGQSHQSMDSNNSGNSNNKPQSENKSKSNSPPMALLSINSSAKLDQEPNPFEQSFSGAQIPEKDKKENKLTLPPVASITSPSPAMPMAAQPGGNNPIIGGGVLPKEVTNQFNWDSLRAGPLSPSMLQGPAHPEEHYSAALKQKANSAASMIHQPQPHHHTIPYRAFSEYTPVKSEPYPPPPPQQRASHPRKRSTSHPSDDDYSLGSSSESNDLKTKSRRSSHKELDSDEEPVNPKKSKTRSSSNKNLEDDEKRKNFLERNRIAALKCRQRKKQWLTNLQAKVEFLTDDNERLQVQSESLKEEIVNLKTLLLAHKECPVAQSNGFHVNAVQKAMPSMLSQQGVTRSISNAPANYSNNNNSNGNSRLAANATSSTHSIPQYQNTNIMPTPQTSNSQSMVAGGVRSSSSVLRF